MFIGLLKIIGTKRVEESHYPVKVFRELLRNACVHRNYSLATANQMEQRKQLYLAAERFVVDDLCALIPIYQEQEKILVHPRN